MGLLFHSLQHLPATRLSRLSCLSSLSTQEVMVGNGLPELFFPGPSVFLSLSVFASTVSLLCILLSVSLFQLVFLAVFRLFPPFLVLLPVSLPTRMFCKGVEVSLSNPLLVSGLSVWVPALVFSVFKKAQF